MRLLPLSLLCALLLASSSFAQSHSLPARMQRLLHLPQDKAPLTPGDHNYSEEMFAQWTGPALLRPYQEHRFHYNWHWFWDTGNGETGNNGPHYTDIARWILKKYEHPVRAQSMGNMEIPDSDQETPTTQISTLEYQDKTRLQIEVRNCYTNSEAGLRMGLLVYGSEGWMRLGTDDWATFFGRKFVVPNKV
jgi:hypothetical protein